MYSIRACTYLTAIFGLPALAVAACVARLQAYRYAALGFVVAAPIVYSLGVGLVAGLLSRLHAKHVTAGRVPRRLAESAYRQRRLYGLCWTAVYYCKPVYFVWLSLPAARGVLFRLFGYRHSLDFTTYPDTWIRDLPLLSLQPGAYLSNRATIGTNIVLMSGELLVDTIRIGRGSIIGHLTMLAPGVSVGDRAEVGVGCAIGIRTKIGDRAKIGPECTIEHAVELGAGCRIGTRSYVGSRSMIGEGVVVPPGSVLAPGTVAATQAELDTVIGRPAGQSKPETGSDENDVIPPAAAG